MSEVINYIVPEGSSGRIDKILSEGLGDSFSRSRIKDLIENGNITVNDDHVKVSEKVNGGTLIVITVPDIVDAEIKPENIPLDIVYEDNDLIIVNKPKGMVVHPAAGHTSGTLVNALMYHCGSELSGINGELRPGIVHRIDRDTTGLLVICKNDNAHRKIAEQLAVHSITRRYEALVYGCFKESDGTVDAPLGRHPVDRKKMAINYEHGKRAVTHFSVLENCHTRQNKEYAHIICRLETGRTHQIRVHMASIHHPLVGDTVYGPDKDPFHTEGQVLHAGVLGFIHPSTGKYVEFSAPLPDYFTDLLENIRKQC